jgi:hypothetical protein
VKQGSSESSNKVRVQQNKGTTREEWKKETNQGNNKRNNEARECEKKIINKKQSLAKLLLGPFIFKSVEMKSAEFLICCTIEQQCHLNPKPLNLTPKA